MTSLTVDEQVLIARLRALLELLPPALDRQVAAIGVTSFEFALLETVAESPGRRLRLSRLASSTNATLPRLSRVMDGLERKGLVERIPDDDDARATQARLTKAGLATLTAARPIMATALRHTVLDPLLSGDGSPDSLSRMSEGLHQIVRVLDPDGRLAVTGRVVDAQDRDTLTPRRTRRTPSMPATGS